MSVFNRLHPDRVTPIDQSRVYQVDDEGTSHAAPTLLPTTNADGTLVQDHLDPAGDASGTSQEAFIKHFVESSGERWKATALFGNWRFLDRMKHPIQQFPTHCRIS